MLYDGDKINRIAQTKDEVINLSKPTSYNDDKQKQKMPMPDNQNVNHNIIKEALGPNTKR